MVATTCGKPLPLDPDQTCPAARSWEQKTFYSEFTLQAQGGQVLQQLQGSDALGRGGAAADSGFCPSGTGSRSGTGQRRRQREQKWYQQQQRYRLQQHRQRTAALSWEIGGAGRGQAGLCAERWIRANPEEIKICFSAALVQEISLELSANRPISQANRLSSVSPVSHIFPCVTPGSNVSRHRITEHKDFVSLAGYQNSSNSYQFSPASVIVPVVFSLIFLLGTVGNSLVLAVPLCNGQMGHNTTDLFILSLSLADFFFIAFCVPFQATIYSLEGWVFGSFICKSVHFFIYLTMYASSFTLAAISVDRYLSICYPLRSRELRTPHNVVAAMAVIWGLSVVFAGPYLSYYDLTEWESNYICMPGWEEWRHKVMDTSTFAFSYVIPVLVISLSYMRTITYLWTAVDPLEDISESRKAKQKETRALPGLELPVPRGQQAAGGQMPGKGYLQPGQEWGQDFHSTIEIEMTSQSPGLENEIHNFLSQLARKRFFETEWDIAAFAIFIFVGDPMMGQG
ncbi:uncharacterized protein LOC104037678 [Pelecanus crispus]|uniref:uncharacterized protein LOC104037678 n=1 Tax=Pelecanus crispus TaxID=36300 RepID=UPI003F5D2F2A